MILHLTPGSGSIELHIHDDAQVALYQPGDKPSLMQADPTSKLRPAPRWLVLGLTGAACLALGYTVAPRGSAAPTRVAGAPTLVRPVVPLPGNIPLAPDAASTRLIDPSDVGLPPVRQRAEAEEAGAVPSAIARQLAQPPVVVPPSTPARPLAGSSAFGLDN